MVLSYLDPKTFPNGWDVFTPQEKEILQNIDQRIVAAQTVEEMVDYLFEQSHDIFPCDRIGIAFCEEDQKRLVAYYARADYQPLELKKGYCEDIQNSSLESIMQSGNLRLINDLPAYAERHPDSRSTRLLLKEGVSSNLTCPLMVDGRIVGVLFRSSKKVRAYDERNAWLQHAIAMRLAQAVEKAYLIEQLRQTNQAYTEMLGFVSHELKSPLSSVVMTAQMLLKGYFGEMQSEQADVVSKIIHRSEFLLNLIKEYLDLTRMETGRLEIKMHSGISLQDDLLNPALEILQPQIENKDMRLEISIPADFPSFEGDPDLLKIVFLNIVGNAIKYGNDEGLIQINARSEDNRIEVAIRNEGPGFPSEMKDRLFRKFSRLPSPELMRRKGTGVGLYTCWKIIQLHHGKITADSVQGEWAEFLIQMPLLQPEDQNDDES